MSVFRAALLAMALALPAHAVTLGDDGLDEEPWLRDTFLDLREDLAEANSEGKRLMLLIEQRGCIYCTKMHEEVFSDPDVVQLIEDNYFVVQINMFGDIPITDFDGEELPEKEMVNHWGAMFTPTMIFLPEEVAEDMSASEASVATMPGAFGKGMTISLFEWVRDHGYESGENFQKYVADKVNAGK